VFKSATGAVDGGIQGVHIVILLNQLEFGGIVMIRSHTRGVTALAAQWA
jgi:hypothetical protein